MPGTQAVTPMDVDEGTGGFCILPPLSTDTFSDASEAPSPQDVIPKVPAGKKTVHLLPYVDVPNMDTSSHTFQKAEATISKQSAPSSALASSTAGMKSSEVFALNQGMIFLPFLTALY